AGGPPAARGDERGYGVADRHDAGGQDALGTCAGRSASRRGPGPPVTLTGKTGFAKPPPAPLIGHREGMWRRAALMKAIIVGGGIGGLTAALMLHARGLDCEVFEQSEAIRELGVGINTLPHAIKELAELGLLDRLDQVAIRTFELFYTNRFGQEIWREPRGPDAGYAVPQFSVHRGHLQGVILQAARARLGEGRIHTGHRLGAYTQDDGGVTAYFFDRTGAHRRTARGDVLIGADGIHSKVRET